jgi:hypothetical protein
VDGNHLVAAFPELHVEHPAEVVGVPGEPDQRNSMGGEELLDRGLHGKLIYPVRDISETGAD